MDRECTATADLIFLPYRETPAAREKEREREREGEREGGGGARFAAWKEGKLLPAREQLLRFGGARAQPAAFVLLIQQSARVCVIWSTRSFVCR